MSCGSLFGDRSIWLCVVRTPGHGNRRGLGRRRSHDDAQGGIWSRPDGLSVNAQIIGLSKGANAAVDLVQRRKVAPIIPRSHVSQIGAFTSPPDPSEAERILNAKSAGDRSGTERRGLGREIRERGKRDVKGSIESVDAAL